MRRILIFGASGSIGGSALSVLREHRREFSLEGLALHRETRELAGWISEFGLKKVAIEDDAARETWRRAHPLLAAGRLIEGPVLGLLDLPADRVLNAVSGFAGLRISLETIDRGLDLALANKESLVCGGSFLMDRLASSGSRLLPVDSEHAAIFQLLEGRDPGSVEKLILTASGGPFLRLPAEQWSSIKPEQALRHPTWNMGPRITVDSATLFNKGLEVIEAAHLFELPEERIEVLVHSQSRIHAMAVLEDGSTLAHMASPDMRLPILQALAWPERVKSEHGRIDFGKGLQLNFEPIDKERFPSIELARSALRRGGTAPLVLNAADEVAVGAFLESRLDFGGIFECVASVLQETEAVEALSWEDLLEADRNTRRKAEAWISVRKEGVARC